MLQATPANRIPTAAFWLGWAGVIPFAGLSLATLTGTDFLPAAPRTVLIGYGAAILSFMGGAQWGLSTVGAWAGDDRHNLRFGVSVLPALLAWPCLFLPQTLALLALSVGFALLLFYDIRTVRAGLAPPWYSTLRVPLTLAAVFMLLVAVVPFGP
jgi:hypothetical protein